MITWQQDLTLKEGAHWMLLSRNGKCILEPGDICGRWTARFLFASKADMLHDIQMGLRARRCGNRMDWTIEKHSIFVARIMELFYPEEEWGALAGLFHDAHEAYSSDIPSPVGALLTDLSYVKSVLDDGIADFLDFDFKMPSSRKIHMADMTAWDLESAELLDFDPADPFLLRHYPDLVLRKRLGLHGMTKGYAQSLETIVRELQVGKHTFESEFRRLTTWR